jgi:hypothetical protein
LPSETLTVPEAAAGLTDTLIVVAEPYVADETLVIVVVVAREVTVTVWVAPLAALYVADCAVCAVSEQVPAPTKVTTRPEAVHTFEGLAETLCAPSPVA